MSAKAGATALLAFISNSMMLADAGPSTIFAMMLLPSMGTQLSDATLHACNRLWRWRHFHGFIYRKKKI